MGNKVGSEFQIQTYTSFVDGVAFSGRHSTTTFSDGGFLVAWDNQDQNSYTGNIYVQKFDNSGNKLGSEINLNTLPTGLQNRPAVSSLSDGGYVVSWTSRGQDVDDGLYGTGVYAQR